MKTKPQALLRFLLLPTWTVPTLEGPGEGPAPALKIEMRPLFPPLENLLVARNGSA